MNFGVYFPCHGDVTSKCIGKISFLLRIKTTYPRCISLFIIYERNTNTYRYIVK